MSRAVPGSAAPVSLPENFEARKALEDTIFAPVGEAAAARPRTLLQAGGSGKVQFRVDDQGGYSYLIFSPPDENGSSVASAGTYIIKRSLKDGSFVQAKIFVQNDPGCYLRLTPLGAAGASRTEMDVVIEGELFQQGITLAQPLERLLVAPFATIVELAAGVVDWSLILPAQRASGDERLEQVVAALRPRLKLLNDTEDGAMDSRGRFVFIKDGSPQTGRGGFNCSGFAKFVIDGFFKPLTGKLTDIEALKERDLESRGNPWSPLYEESRDPYLGLDWSRNLARALEAARTGGGLPDAEFADVREVERFTYAEDIGYPIEDVGTILYLLARRDPGYLYIGSLNQEAADGAPVRLHHHLAVFFPYADRDGVLRIVVMERNVETSIASLQKRFPTESIHLVRISTEGEFRLP